MRSRAGEQRKHYSNFRACQAPECAVWRWPCSTGQPRKQPCLACGRVSSKSVCLAIQQEEVPHHRSDIDSQAPAERLGAAASEDFHIARRNAGS